MFSTWLQQWQGKEVGYSWNSPTCTCIEYGQNGQRRLFAHAMQETKYLIKKPRAEVQEEKKRSVEFPGHKKVKAAIQRHPAMLR